MKTRYVTAVRITKDFVELRTSLRKLRKVEETVNRTVTTTERVSVYNQDTHRYRTVKQTLERPLTFTTTCWEGGKVIGIFPVPRWSKFAVKFKTGFPTDVKPIILPLWVANEIVKKSWRVKEGLEG